MNNVRLSFAISNLAWQAKINYIVIPRASPASIGPVDREASEKRTSCSLKGLSPEQALAQLLKDQNLKLLSDAATSVARIVPSGEPEGNYSANHVNEDTNQLMPLCIICDAPVDEVIYHLARRANLKVAVDPKLRVPSCGPEPLTVSTAVVSVRWENIRPRQALTALLDSCELDLVEEPATSTATIVQKEP